MARFMEGSLQHIGLASWFPATTRSQHSVHEAGGVDLGRYDEGVNGIYDLLHISHLIDPCR